MVDDVVKFVADEGGVTGEDEEQGCRLFDVVLFSCSMV